MLEISFSCPVCSRLFLEDCHGQRSRRFVPRHLDPLLGHPCPASGRETASFLEIPDHPHPPDDPDWPRWETHARRPPAQGGQDEPWRASRPLPRGRTRGDEWD